MLIDTHCHLDAPEFAPDRSAVVARARAAQVQRIIVPAVELAGFTGLAALAREQAEVRYALGVHPMFASTVLPIGVDAAAQALRAAVMTAIDDPRFIGIGEIGLDGFDKTGDPVLQKALFEAQLRIAREFELPVILHVRKAVDPVLAALRRFRITSGIAHAFNGSFQQAHAAIGQGLALGFGGALTFTRALQLRRLVSTLPLEAIVLETDAPDIAPAWVAPGRNEPMQVTGVAQHVAELRGDSLSDVVRVTARSAQRALPRLDIQH